MDYIFLILHILVSFLFVKGWNVLIVVVYTALYYNIIVDRLLLNLLISLLISKPIVDRVIQRGESDSIGNIVIWANFITEIVKAPISAYLGSLLLLQFFHNNEMVWPFAIGLLLYSFNFHFVGGIFRMHPFRFTMYICVVVGTLLVVTLMKV